MGLEMGAAWVVRVRFGAGKPHSFPLYLALARN